MNINTLLNTLQLPEYSYDICKKAINVFIEATPDEMSTARIAYAQGFCQLLVYCQKLVDKKIVMNAEWHKELLRAFSNIRGIGVEAEVETIQDGCIQTLLFLNELEARGREGSVYQMNNDCLEKSMPILLQELQEIRFLFDLKEQDDYVFPIHQLIAKVIDRSDFVNACEPIGAYQVNILQLAVRLFCDDSDIKERLNQLKNKCNLQFIDFLVKGCDIIDSYDLLNYRNNQVMIFYDYQQNRVLVRHDRREYFSEVVKSDERFTKVKIEEETDTTGEHVIGYFVIFPLDEGDELIDFSEALSNITGRREFLNIVFEKKIRNLMIQKMIIRKRDGSLSALNPFSVQDKRIVKAKLDQVKGQEYELKDLGTALNKYRNAYVAEKGLNVVTFGLCLKLLEFDNVGMKQLGLDQLIEDNWFQNQVLENWVTSSKSIRKSLEFLGSLWNRELEYCQGQSDIENYEVTAQNLLPYYCDLAWIFNLLNCLQEERNIYFGTLYQYEDGKYLEINKSATYDGKKLMRKRVDTGISIDNIRDVDKIFDEKDAIEKSYYFIYDFQNQHGLITEQNVLKLLDGIKRLQGEYSLKKETADRVTLRDIQMISERMELHRLSFEQIGKTFFSDFTTQIKYRMIHNMVWSKIDLQNIRAYLKLIENHQLLKYENIRDDEIFLRKEEGTLYVPKDGQSADGVLRSIYINYLQEQAERERQSLYESNIEFDSKIKKYTFRSKEIKKLVFLFDNVEYGTATCNTLKAYLDIFLPDEAGIKTNSAIKKAYKRRHCYYCNGKEVSVSEILRKNQGAEVVVHSFYGTEEGKENIDALFKNSKINYKGYDYFLPINVKAKDLIELVKQIPTWNISADIGDFYAVIRQYNMTKANVFPEEMISDGKKAIAMFIKKKELL